MANISQITLPNGNTYDLKDANAATESYVDTRLASKQDTLTAGTGINIDANNVISATGGGTITDVQVDGVSVVTSGVAEIDLTPYVAKSGDTMTGTLHIDDALLKINYYNENRGAIAIQNKSYAIDTSSNNGIPSGAFHINGLDFVDSNELEVGGLQSYAYSNGAIYSDIYAYDKKTDGSSASNRLRVGIAKNGTCLYEVTDPAAFRSAIGAGTSSTDTTYTIATGDNNGQIKVTPSSGSAYNVSVKGLGSAAYLTANTAASNSTVVQRNSSGYVYANYFNTTCGAANPSSYTNSRALFTSDDGFIRKATAANFRTMLGLGSMATANTSSYVAKAGDTMSGNLTISVSGEGQFSTKSTAWGMDTSSNNGLSANGSAGAFYHKDKNNNIVARTNCYGQSDGQTVLCIQSYNRTTSNAEVMTGLWIWSKKNGTHAYTVTDAAAFRTGIGAAASSSRAYKENIQNMTEEEAKKILNVNIYSYDYKDGFGETNHNKNQFGVIAEEVIEQIPYAVNIPDKYDEEEALKSSNDPSKGGRNLITIDYWKFVPYLIKTVQVQEKRINELEEEIKVVKEAIGL